MLCFARIHALALIVAFPPDEPTHRRFEYLGALRENIWGAFVEYLATSGGHLPLSHARFGRGNDDQVGASESECLITTVGDIMRGLFFVSYEELAFYGITSRAQTLHLTD